MFSKPSSRSRPLEAVLSNSLPNPVADDATSDGIIRVMSDRLANKIAAGEVVQRPASVAKELIENALDAGASSVDLLVKDAGSTLVQVVDDGCGMSAPDAVRCFQRHATSKIGSVDDLERIRTLGFRGEALASIASVSQVELKTKRVEDDVGTQVRVEGGDPVDRRPCATANGTSVAVKNLFYNVPARRNFLKTPATELKHLSDTFQFLALSNPEVAFRMEHNDHELYDLPAAQDDGFFAATRERILELFGDDDEEALLAVDDASSDVSVRGFVGTPDRHRSAPSQQFLFVNERYVRDRYLSHAVKKAYGELLPDKTFPFFALFLSMDPRRVDVNVHPAKSEVNFDDESGLYGFLTSAVRRTLRRQNVTPQFRAEGPDGEGEGGASPASFQPRSADAPASSDTAASPGNARSGPNPSSGPAPSGPAPSGNGAPSADSPFGSSPGSSSGSSGSSGGVPPGEQSEALYGRRAPGSGRDGGASPGDSPARRPDAQEGGKPASGAGGQRPLWSVHDTYLLSPTNEGLLLVDQRAAHLRVLYEQALTQLRGERGEAQQLLFPQTVDLPPAQAETLEEWLPDLRALGFEIERMSGRTVALRSVPAAVPEGKEPEVLQDILQTTRSRTEVQDERRKHLARQFARQNAVRRGQALADPERRRLLNDLFRCEMPYADPSGNPTLVRLSMEELAELL